MSNPIRRLTTPNLGKNDVYLSLHVPNTEAGKIFIPMANEMFPVRDKTQDPTPKMGQAKTLLAPCTFAWLNHPSHNTLNVAAGDFTDIARFQEDLRQSIYQQLRNTTETDLQQKPWTDLIDPMLKQQLDMAMVSDVPAGGEKQHVDHLNPGYIYLYKDNYLWREIYVNENGTYSEVNLTRYAGQNQRRHTGVMDWSVVIPQRVHGHIPEYQIAYAPVQWSWARINYFGGMDPQDLRIANKKTKPPMPSDLPHTKIPNDPTQNRTQRMQTINLTPFADPDAAINKTTSGDGDVPNVLLIEKSLHPTILLADPVGLAARLSQDLSILNLQLQQLMHEATQEKRFQTALMCQQIFFNPNTAFSKTVKETLPLSTLPGVNGSVPQTITGSVDNAVKKAAKNLDRDKVEQILRVKERAALRNLIKIMQHALIELISNTTPSWYNTPIDFNTEFKDICANGDYNYTQAFASLAGILANTGYNPHSLDRGLDIELASKAPFVPPAAAYIKKLTTPSHPLYDALFPSDEQVEDAKKKIKADPHYAQGITQADCVKYDVGNGAFNTMAFAMSFEALQSESETLFESLVTLQEGFTRRTNAEQEKTNMKNISKWYHVSGQPVLADIKIVKTGKVPEGYDILGFDKDSITRYKTNSEYYYSNTKTSTISKQDKITLSQHIKAGTEIPYTLTSKVQSQKINLVAQFVDSSNPSQRAANSNYNVNITGEQTNSSVLRQYTVGDVGNNTGASFATQSTVNETYQSIATGELGNTISANTFAISEQKIADITQSASHGLSIVLLGMQLYNLARVRSATVKYQNKAVKITKAFEILGFTMYSIEATYTHFKQATNARNLYHIFSKELPSKETDWVVAFQDYSKIVFRVSRLTPLATIGGAACVINLGFSLYDMFQQIKEDNPGEAAADLLQIGSDAFSALAILQTYAEGEAAFEGLLTLFGPFGLVAAILGLIALIVASIFEETPLEHWVKTCPLSLQEPDKLMTEYASCTSLLSLLLTPNAAISQLGDSTHQAYQNIVVYVALPSFKIGDSSLQVQTTYSKETQPDSTAMYGVPLPPAIQPGDLPQHNITPTEMQECIDDKGRVIGMRYIYQNIPANLKSEHSFLYSQHDQIHYRTRVRLYTNKHKYCLPYIEGQTKKPKAEALPKNGHIDTTQPGWICAENTF